MKCPHCFKDISRIKQQPCDRTVLDKIYIIVQEKRLGFTGHISEGQERFWETLGWVFNNKENAETYGCYSTTRYVYECKLIGRVKGK